MMTRPIVRRVLASAVALCLAAPFSVAQDAEVQPPSRTLLLSAGKSAVVKIDTGNCKPTWTATSANDAVATVSPATASAGNKRSFKIIAPKGQFSASTTVDITLDGMGVNCDQMEVVTIEVFVVMDANAPKHYASGDKNTGIVGTKKRLKELKKTGADISKQLKKDLKTIVKQLKTDSLPAQEGPGGELPPPLFALRLATDCADEALDLLEDAFEAYIEGLAGDGYNLMSLYGFLDFLDEFIASEFQTGSCGLWDGAVHDGSELVNGLTYDFDQSLKKTASQIEVASAWSTTPMTANTGTTSTEFPLSTGGLDPTTTGKFDKTKDKTLKVKKVESTNYVEGNNSNHGRITMKGRALASDGPVTITYERLDSSGNPVGMGTSDFFEETGVTPNAKCKFKGRAPGDPTLANLNSGRWRVTVTQGSGDSEKSASKFHTISAN
jgi:hypothetical protein